MRPESDPPFVRQIAMGCFGVGLAIAFIAAIVAYLVSHSFITAILVLAAVMLVPVIVAWVYLRQKVADSYYEVRVEPVPTSVKLGDSFDFRAMVLPKRDLRIGRGQVVLRCQEHAISRGGSSDSHYRQTLFEQPVDLPEGRRYTHGEALEIRQRLTIPADAIPSFAGHNNSIEWRVLLRVPMPGICPDLHEALPLSVAPCFAPGADTERAAGTGIPVRWSEAVTAPTGLGQVGTVTAELRGYEGPTLHGLPAAAVGERLRLSLRVRTDGDLHCRGVLAQVCCHLHGSGTAEEVVVFAEQQIHEGDFAAGQVAEHTYEVTVPDSGPVSFEGRYVKMDWCVRVRVDIPIWVDKRLTLPFLVTPRVSSERE
ncbi:hypothetical protein LLH03_03765 [bacterium]|nr:hypothetical protein [bacterium]